METLALTHSYIAHEEPSPEFELSSLDQLGLKIPSSAWATLAGVAVAVSVMNVAAPSHAATYVSTNGGRLNVRCGPGMEYCVGGKLENGKRVHLTGNYENGWAELTNGGWVASQWLSYDRPRYHDDHDCQWLSYDRPRYHHHHHSDS